MNTSMTDTTTDNRNRWAKLSDAVLGTLDDLRPVTQKTARKRAQRASQIWYQAGMEQAARLISERVDGERRQGAR